VVGATILRLVLESKDIIVDTEIIRYTIIIND